MTPEGFLILIIVILSADFLLDQVLDYLNLKNSRTELPEEVKNIYQEDEYKKSQEYLKTNARFGFITSTFNFILVLAAVASGVLGWLSNELTDEFQNPIITALIFFGILYLVSDLLNTPFSAYKTFVIEEKYGFNKTSPGTFITDKLKGYLLTAIIGGLILAILLWLVYEIGQNFWLWFWVFISIFLVFINMFYTSIFIPLFNKLTPLEDGELRQAIEDYSKGVGFELNNIFVIDGSKRSTKANAFFSGIGKQKKIVLFDTLVNNHSKEEIVSVLAHEVGHYKKNHILQGMLLSILQVGIMLFILSLFVFNPALSQALGAEGTAVHLNLLAFGIIFTPVSHILGLGMNLFSRKNEYEADQFAAETYSSEHLGNALKKLSVKNLSNLTPHPAYVFMHYSHPTLLQRLDHMTTRTPESPEAGTA